MEYGKIISVTGMGGLYELVGSKKDGAIVRSLEDKSTKFVSSRIHNFSHLESIEVYTVRDNVNLVDLLKAIDASGEALPSEKDAAAVKAFFQKVYPDMDFERVYASDMKKMIKWYAVLKANDVEFKLSEVEEEEEDEIEASEEIGNEAPEPVTVEAVAAQPEPEVALTEPEPEVAPTESEPEIVEAEVSKEAPKKRAPRKKKAED